ncbi:MAG: RimK family alpha-L-glutamate ligase [Lachnospiraceae bacterium]|nr:RimK family alpha-L-glutamate ligase [Lachnospiraceae bacterium]
MNKGLLITNRFLRTNKFVEHYEWLSAAAHARGISLDLWDNASLPICYGEQLYSNLVEQMRPYQFILYWDKDVRFGRYLMSVCENLGIPIYNSVEAMAVCDDKSETYRVLQRWNEQAVHKQEQIPILPTVVAPMTYAGIGYTNLDFLQEIIHRLQFPMVIKECFGSFGQQVYLVSEEQSLQEWTRKLSGTPFLYQKYLHDSHGHDLRLQVVGDQVVAAMHRFSVDGDFRANLTNGGQMESYEPSERECTLAVRVVQALGLDFAGVDLLFSNGPDAEADVVCEVNSNAHFRNIAECTGVNVAEKIMEYIIGNKPNFL